MLKYIGTLILRKLFGELDMCINLMWYQSSRVSGLIQGLGGKKNCLMKITHGSFRENIITMVNQCFSCFSSR